MKARLQIMQRAHPLAKLQQTQLTHLQVVEGIHERRDRLIRQLGAMVIAHTRRVVNRQHYLVVPLIGLDPAQPDLVLAILRRNVLDHSLHVQPLATLVVALELGTNSRLQNQPQLLTQLLGHLLGQRLILLPELQTLCR